MSAVLRLDESDLRAVVGILDELERRLIDLRPAWEELRRRWQARTEEHWRTARWKRLSNRYARRVGRTKATLDTSVGRRPRNLGHQPGQLRRLVTMPETFESSSDRVVMGVRYGQGRSRAWIAQFHQEGRGVPRRPVWRRLNPSERRDWTGVVADQILEVLR